MTFIFTPTMEGKGIGVYDNGTTQMVVEVFSIRKELFSFSVEGNSSTNIVKTTAAESWADVATYLGATLIKTFDKKDLKRYDVYKSYLKEQKALKQKKKEEALDKENETVNMFGS